MVNVATVHRDIIDEWRNSLFPSARWSDKDPPATNIHDARLRGKYYGGLYMMLRPFLYMALHHWTLPPGPAKGGNTFSPDSSAATSDFSSGPAIATSSSRALDMVELIPEQKRMLSVAAICVDAAIQSTIAFDRVGVDPKSEYRPYYAIPDRRFIVTNPFGTLHA